MDSVDDGDSDDEAIQVFMSGADQIRVRLAGAVNVQAVLISLQTS